MYEQRSGDKVSQTRAHGLPERKTDHSLIKFLEAVRTYLLERSRCPFKLSPVTLRVTLVLHIRYRVTPPSPALITAMYIFQSACLGSEYIDRAIFVGLSDNDGKLYRFPMYCAVGMNVPEYR